MMNLSSSIKMGELPVLSNNIVPKNEISELTESKRDVTFVKAPQKFFGKYLAVNVAERTVEEKEANRAVRMEFHAKLQEFFGPILAEYLYPREKHQQKLQEGKPLAPEHAQEIVTKGEEMLETLVRYCGQHLSDDDQSLSRSNILDQAMVRYAKEEEAKAFQQAGGIIDFLPHVIKTVGGGAMAVFAVATMGQLTPTDIFFLLDLLSSKKLSKEIENFITAKLTQHIEYHLESYLQERRNSKDPNLEEEKKLRNLLKSNVQLFSHESVYPSAKSGGIHTADLLMGGDPDVHNVIDAVKLIFQGEAFTTGAHNQLFRDGVTAVIENLKKIQDSIFQTTASAAELGKIKKAILTAQQQAAIDIEMEGSETWKDIPDQQPKKQASVPVPWKRGLA